MAWNYFDADVETRIEERGAFKARATGYGGEDATAWFLQYMNELESNFEALTRTPEGARHVKGKYVKAITTTPDCEKGSVIVFSHTPTGDILIEGVYSSCPKDLV